MAMSLEESLRQMTQCKVCLEQKEYQKQLPCQHTLCLECLNKLEIYAPRYKCPICKKEHLVPNGGFEALPESMVTKQLAQLINASNFSAAVNGRNNASGDGSEGGELPSEAAKKLSNCVSKGRETLQLAETRINMYEQKDSDLVKTAEDMKEKLQTMMEEEITRLRTGVERKINAINERTKLQKESDSLNRTKLTEAYKKADDTIKEIESKVKELQKTGVEEDVSGDLQRAQASLEILKDQMHAGTETNTTEKFKEGDSVRLRMDPAEVKTKFLTKNLDHSDIGYIQSLDSDGDCHVVFPNYANWNGNTKTLDKSMTPHNLPVVGDRVRVKKSVTEPFFEWRKVTHESIGILKAFPNFGPSEGRAVVVKFPENPKWRGLFEELEKAPPVPLKIGDEVWIGKDVSEPARGWAGVTFNSVGTLLSVNGDDVTVNFPECEQWQGLLSEIEHVRPISVGDQVKVKKSVKEPTCGWVGVTHDDEGEVMGVEDVAKHGEIAIINFPTKLGLWKCLIGELELVRRAGSSSSTCSVHSGIISGRDIHEHLQEQHRQMEEQCKTQ